MPVALHCVWSLGFATTTPRVLVHSIAGCGFYGAYAAKMLGCACAACRAGRSRCSVGRVFALFLLVWSTSALWFFTRSGVPLF